MTHLDRAPAPSEQGTPNQAQRNQDQWRDPANWHWGVYNSPRDTRVWVPKAIPWTGWTLNFAHRAAWVLMFALVLPAIAVAILAIFATAG